MITKEAIERLTRLRKVGFGYDITDEDRAAIDAVLAALSAIPAVRVKALEWSEGPFLFVAETTIGSYYLEDQGRNWAGDRYWLTSGLIKVALKFPTLEAAKAAAQADYEARVLSAIEPGGVETLLREENEKLRGALKPFARIADMEEKTPIMTSVMVNVDLCRNASAALKGDEQ